MVAVKLDFHVDLGNLASLGTAGARATMKVQSAIRETAYAIEAKGKMNCPVDTGNLRASISTTVGGLEAEIGPTAHYGAYVENGTSRMRPQPYMGPAADSEFPQIDARINRILDGLL